MGSLMGFETPTNKQLPMVVLLRPPLIYTLFENEFSKKFRFLKVWESTDPAQFLAENATHAEAMLCSSRIPITAEVLRQLPSLRLIVTTSSGLNHIDMAECQRRKIAIANAGNVFSDDVADAAVGLLIDVLRKITASDRYIRAGLWPKADYPLGSKLRGKRVGIVGLGSIGLAVATRLEAFGCSISYTSRVEKPNVRYRLYRDILKLAAECNVLVICCRLNDQTRHIINKDVLKALGKDGVVVNIARGAVIDEKELVRCLVEGEIGGAGLDVFENEPDVPKELFALDNVVLSPHWAVCTEESMSELFELMSGNLEAFFGNKPLLSPAVDN